MKRTGKRMMMTNLKSSMMSWKKLEE